ncbi:MAG: GTP 3',8-cyclase MoaA [Actinomycetia bacterium]|nr:GTP 3',8-cyclase MoaA [Actinomycetes bacterium]
MAVEPVAPGTGTGEVLIDRYGRVARKLRVSLTDRCNFRCVYCMPEHVTFMPSDELLTADEIVRIVGVFARLGVEKVRLTGGEPLLRPEVVDITRRIKAIPGIRTVSLTTNGVRLPQLAAPLKAAGLDGVNVSLDSLDAGRFRLLARRDQLEAVLEGIRAARAAGLDPVKVNCVVMRGVNDEEIPAFLRWAAEEDLVVRFIEFMPLDADNIWERRRVVTLAEILQRAETLGAVEPVAEDPTSPARLFRVRGLGVTFGVIASVSRPFCAACDRVRLTAEGRVRNCLFATTETDLRDLVRRGASDDELAAVVRDAVWSKWAGHLINRPGFVKPERTMHRIGG